MRFLAAVAFIFVATACPTLSAPVEGFAASGGDKGAHKSPSADVASISSQNTSTGTGNSEFATNPTTESVSTRRSLLSCSDVDNSLNVPRLDERVIDDDTEMNARSLDFEGHSIVPRGDKTQALLVGGVLVTIGVSLGVGLGLSKNHKQKADNADQ
ncbi:hypothetical protein BC835DRAFT_1414109 [Cytidiella melzeri]|nr:hypothetical protein BC835DRAFT_1414109 [Cytidiella melzeri]